MKLLALGARRFATFASRIAFALAAVSLAVLMGCAQLFAQGSAGRIIGAITDQTGGAVSGATVSIVDTQRNLTRTLTTDGAGEYNAPNLLPGTYTVRAAFQGFKTAERSGITLEVNQDLRVDLTLQPGEQTEKVTVTGELPLVETTNAELGGTLQNATINQLPLNGRNFENLLDLRPGVVKYPGNSGWTQSTNGLRPHDNMFLVEGINSNDPWMAQSVMNAVMAGGDAGTILPIDAIDQFKTEVNPRAQYGWKPGAVVNVGVKSGTNNYHGTAYAFGRDGNWDANNFFTGASALQVEQFGATFGAPLIKDKLFYFLNFEQQRYSVENPVVRPAPITAPGVGAPASNLIGACLAAGAGLKPLSAQIAGLDMSCAPLSNYPGLFTPNSDALGQLSTNVPTVNTINSGLAKVDYHLNQKNTLSGMYFISPGSGTFVDNPTTEVDPNRRTLQYARSQVGSGSWVFIPSSQWVNEFHAGLSHYYQTFFAVDHTQDPANYPHNGATYHIYTGQTNPVSFGLPALQIQGFGASLTGAGWPKIVGPNSVIDISDHLSYLRGTHAFMFGGEILSNRSTNFVTSNTKGNVRFSNLTNFFTGTMNRAQFTAGDFHRQLSDWGYAAFLQDDWRIKPRITLNLGLRYEITTVVKEASDLIGNFDPTLGLVQVGKQVSSPYNGDHNNFSPRLGLAWDISGNGKTVLRAGGSLIYEQGSFDSLMALGNLLGLRTLPTGVNLFTNGNATPFTLGGTINLGAITLTKAALGPVKSAWAANGPSNPLFSATPACGDGSVTIGGFTPQPCTVMGVDRNLRTPYVTTWMLDLQRAISTNLSLDMAYVGNRSTNLVGVTDLNQPLPGAGWTAAALSGCLAAPTPDSCAPDGAAITAARPYNARFPYLSYIEWLSNDNRSNYNGLQASLTQRASHGLSYVVGYTFSHALAMSPDNWSFVAPINSYNVGNLYGNSEFDITHRFTLSVNYDLPGIKSPAHILEGWSINSIVNISTAAPWGVNDVSTDFSGTDEINDQASTGEKWNFYGNTKDFTTTKAFLNSNGGGGGIPFFPGSCADGSCTSLPAASAATSNATCNTQAAALGPAAVASLSVLGCYANGSSVLIPPGYGTYGTSAPNMFRGTPFRNWDFSIVKNMKFKERLTAQFRAEFFNILNHPNISNPFGGPGGDNTFTDPTANAPFGFRSETPDVTSSNPVLGSGGPRSIQLGLKLIF